MEDNIWESVLPESQQTVWHELKQDIYRLQQFNYYLAGGTALALQLGHRQSVDLDFFTQDPDVGQSTYEWMQEKVGFVMTELDANTLHGELNGVKLSFIGNYKYPCVESLVEIKGIPSASMSDIGAMKLLAVTLRATLRDYVDVAAIIGSGIPLKHLLEVSKIKYGSSFNPMVPVRALSAYDSDDIDNEMPRILDRNLEKNWRDILRKSVKEL